MPYMDPMGNAILECHVQGYPVSRCSKYGSRLLLTTPHIRGEKLTNLDLSQGTTDLLGFGRFSKVQKGISY